MCMWCGVWQVSYNTAMKACATGKRWREAVSLLNAMLAQGLRPDGVSYRTVMNACIEGGEWDHALKIFDRMREDGLHWDTTSYNVAIKVGRSLDHQPARPAPTAGRQRFSFSSSAEF